MGADEIWAHESTITGSIGIFGLWPTIEKPLDKVGIHSDGVGTTVLAASMRIDRPMTPEMRTIMQSTVNFGYHQFVSGVAQGRALPQERVEEIARGRVWSGEAALKLGLVDKIGDLQDAVKSAAELADLHPGEYRLEPMTPHRTWLQEVLGSVAEDSHAQSLLTALHLRHTLLLQEAESIADALKRFNDPRGVYALCLCTPAVN